MISEIEKAKAISFWEWFEKNQKILFHYENDRETIFDQLSTEMCKVNENLTFEFGTIRDNGTREFVISAAGNKDIYSSVEVLHSLAPHLSMWKIIKYRQRQTLIYDIDYAGQLVKSDEVHFVFLKEEDPDKVGIMLFLDGYTEEDRDSIWAHIGYLFLDGALGEYDVEMHVGSIIFSDPKHKFFEHAHPLLELSTRFDEKLGRRIIKG